VEGDGRGEREPLVAVDQRLRPGRRVQQRGSLVVERGVGVLAERRGPWSRRRGVEQADVPHLDVTQRPARDVH
jgi:hypothetical protein